MISTDLIIEIAQILSSKKHCAGASSSGRPPAEAPFGRLTTSGGVRSTASLPRARSATDPLVTVGAGGA